MRSVRTTLHILDAVADSQPIGLSELARRLELPKSTVQRSLATLADLGWIRADAPESPRWRLGDHVRQLGEKVDELGNLREVALRVLSRLGEQTGETIHLAVPDGANMRLVERLDSKHPLRLVRPIGNKSPMHACSTGKSVLAALPPAELELYVAAGLSAVTPNTIVDADEFRDELQLIHDRGYAIANQELADGTSSVGASIQVEGRPVAALSVSGASFRFTTDVCRDYGQLVAAAAKEISSGLVQ